MGFPANIVEDALVKCARCCCVCHKFCGTKIETDHIVQKAHGGADDADNCIPVCFDCHAETHQYNDKHPKGRKFTPSELRRHRDEWYAKVANSHGVAASNAAYLELDRALYRKIAETLDTQYIEFMRHHHFGGSFRGSWIKPGDRFVVFARQVENEFLDGDLEQLKSDLVAAIKHFSEVLNVNVFVKPGTGVGEVGKDLDFVLGVPAEWELDNPERHRDICEAINAASTDVVEKHAAFVRTARRKLLV